MGKGVIISGGTDGLYSVQLLLDRSNLASILEKIDEQIQKLEDIILTMAEGPAKELIILKQNSYIKEKEYVLNNLPDDPIIDVWCADKTENLSGNVGTIEVPGERTYTNIQPGYGGNAVYDSERDGQIQPSIMSKSTSGTVFNWAMMSGWQKWMPTYRYGTITAIDYINHTCSVVLDDIRSSQQNFDINYLSNLIDVPIQYMSCNSSVFSVGDAVIIKFSSLSTETIKNWDTGVVIGFKDNPQGSSMFVALGQISRNWMDVDGAANGDVYACADEDDIYIQTNGVGDFLPLGQTYRRYSGISGAANGDVYACAFNNDDVYRRISGAGDFLSLGQTTRDWRGIKVMPNGDIYTITGSSGAGYNSIYKNFVNLNQTLRNWSGIDGTPNGDVYATCSDENKVFIQVGGVGDFIDLSQTSRYWYKMAGVPNGNIYCNVINGDIYMRTNGAGNFVALDQTHRNWRGMGGPPNGSVYACEWNGDIYKQTN